MVKECGERETLQLSNLDPFTCLQTLANPMGNYPPTLAERLNGLYLDFGFTLAALP